MTGYVRCIKCGCGTPRGFTYCQNPNCNQQIAPVPPGQQSSASHSTYEDAGVGAGTRTQPESYRRRRAAALIATGSLIGLMLLLPPYHTDGACDGSTVSYGFVGVPPEYLHCESGGKSYQKRGQGINHLLWLVPIGIVAGIGITAAMVVGRDPAGPRRKPGAMAPAKVVIAVDRTQADPRAPIVADDQRPIPPPGWLKDPRGEAQMRWWDGDGWTDSTYG